MEFRKFKEAVARSFAEMQKYPLVRTDVSGDELWQTYLNAFPLGSNPIFRQRGEHDCGCCKQFIRTIGNVVAILPDGRLLTLWDLHPVGEPEYQTVAIAMGNKVRAAAIDNFFMHYEKTVGTDKNFEQLVDGQKTWEHFHVTLPTSVIKPKAQIASLLGEWRSRRDVFARGLTTLTDDAIDTVLELIAQKSLYRGEEFAPIVKKFKEVKQQFVAAGSEDTFIWRTVNTLAPAVATIRNSAIGTLLVDLSDGVEMEQAVKSFEAKVAPANYKRPTALVTKRMIDDAKKTIAELGLTSALERRYARLTDITVNNVLFASRATKKAIAGDVFDTLKESVVDSPRAFDKVEEIGINDFLANVVPQVKSIEVLVENRHVGNFVSLITAADPTAQQLFKWSNPFSWSYTGDVTDSIKQRVKNAGGNVTGDVCCRLAWFNGDDLDFHMNEHDRHDIGFSTYRRRNSPNGGQLDVDMNGCDAHDNEAPVENIFYAEARTMSAGTYRLYVNVYSKRDNRVDRQGFEVEIEILGERYRFAYPKTVRSGENIIVAEIIKTKDGTFEVKGSLESASVSKDVWGVKTQTFVEVGSIMLSPNHWDGCDTGNRHWFFMLNGCRNDGTARGLYNEFLKSDLDKHRKVMEMVGSKMHTEHSDEQLSGLGFSSTKRDTLICRVTGSFTRVLRVVF